MKFISRSASALFIYRFLYIAFSGSSKYNVVQLISVQHLTSYFAGMV